MRGVILALGALPVLAFAAESYPTCHVPPEAGHSCSDMGMKSCGNVCIEKDEVCCPDMSGGCPASAYCLANKEGSYDCCDNGETCGSPAYPVLPSSSSSAVHSSSTEKCDEETSKAPGNYPVPTSVSTSATTMTYPGSGAVTSEAPIYTTSTVCSTNIYTVTKCADMANGGYCASSSTTVVTDIIPISTTVCTVTPTVTPTTYGYTTSTIYATTIHTITSCAPNAGYCPAESTVKVTDTYAISTTVCAITTKDAQYPGATHVPGSGPTYPPKGEYPGSGQPGAQYPGSGSGQPGSEYPGTGSGQPGAEYPGQGSHEQPAPYVPAPGSPTKAYPAPGSGQTGAYAPGQPGAPGAPGAPAPYPGVAQPTAYHTGGVKPIETGYPVTAGAASLESVSKVLVAVVVGAVAML